MKSIGPGKIRLLGVLLLLAFASGCFTERWHHDNWSNNNGIRENDRGGESGWDSDQNADRDHDGRRQAERNAEGYPQQYPSDTR